MKRVKPISIILILACLIRLIGINESFWLDEATVGVLAREMSFSQIIGDFALGDFHPPLYYLIVKAWSSIFGSSEVSLRLVSLFFGVGSVYLVYLIGKTVKSRVFGNLAAFIFSINPLHVYYSREARMYAMSTFFVTLCFYSFIKLFRKNAPFKYWYIFSFSLALLFLTDYMNLFVLPVFWAVAVYKKRHEREFVLRFVFSHAALLLAGLAILPVFREQFISGLAVKEKSLGWWSVLGAVNFKNAFLLPIKMVIGRIGFENRYVYGVVLALFFSFYGFLFYGIIKNYKKYLIFFLWFVIPILLGVLIGYFIPIFTYFRFVYIVPAFCLLSAYAIFEFNERYFLPLLGGILLISLFSNFYYIDNERFHREDWRSLSRFLSEKKDSEDKDVRLLFPSNSQREGLVYYNAIYKDLGYEDAGGLKEGEVYLVRYVWDVFDPTDSVRKRLEEVGFIKVNEHNFNGVILFEYEKSNESYN